MGSGQTGSVKGGGLIPDTSSVMQSESLCSLFLLLQVSWFRRHGSLLDILTVGRDSFSLDARYSVAFERPDNWRLQVRPTLRRDDGSYLCQVSTHPPIILVTHLKIIGMDEEEEEEELPSFRLATYLRLLIAFQFPKSTL